MIPWLFRSGAAVPEQEEILSLTDDERRAAHMAASLVLDYPEASRRARFPEVETVTLRLPGPLSDAFAGFFAAIADVGQAELEAHYTSTFDEKRKCCPYLTYYAAGDTRRRGMALVRFAEAYREAGWEPASGELPDYLPVVLEFSARSDSDRARELLGVHREGIEVLYSALVKMESPYRYVLDAVRLSLPQIDEATRERHRALIAEGPPVEMVGLESVPIDLKPYSPSAGAHEGAFR